MKRHRIFAILVTLFASLLLVAPVQAYTQPAVNLGMTSFLDGGPPRRPWILYHAIYAAPRQCRISRRRRK